MLQRCFVVVFAVSEFGPGIYCMGNCAHALAMKTRGLANDSRYKTCCAQRCCSYANDECSNVVDARYSVFEETL